MAFGKDSSASKRARVKLQLRDKKGRWIEMGSGVKWFSASLNKHLFGKVVDAVSSGVARVEVEQPAGSKPLTIDIASSQLEKIASKASIPTTADNSIKTDIGTEKKTSVPGTATEKDTSNALFKSLHENPATAKKPFGEDYEEVPFGEGEGEEKLLKNDLVLFYESSQLKKGHVIGFQDDKPVIQPEVSSNWGFGGKGTIQLLKNIAALYKPVNKSAVKAEVAPENLPAPSADAVVKNISAPAPSNVKSLKNVSLAEMDKMPAGTVLHSADKNLAYFVKSKDGQWEHHLANGTKSGSSGTPASIKVNDVFADHVFDKKMPEIKAETAPAAVPPNKNVNAPVVTNTPEPKPLKDVSIAEMDKMPAGSILRSPNKELAYFVKNKEGQWDHYLASGTKSGAVGAPASIKINDVFADHVFDGQQTDVMPKNPMPAETPSGFQGDNTIKLTPASNASGSAHVKVESTDGKPVLVQMNQVKVGDVLYPVGTPAKPYGTHMNYSDKSGFIDTANPAGVGTVKKLGEKYTTVTGTDGKDYYPSNNFGGIKQTPEIDYKIEELTGNNPFAQKVDSPFNGTKEEAQAEIDSIQDVKGQVDQIEKEGINGLTAKAKAAVKAFQDASANSVVTHTPNLNNPDAYKTFRKKGNGEWIALGGTSYDSQALHDHLATLPKTPNSGSKLYTPDEYVKFRADKFMSKMKIGEGISDGKNIYVKNTDGSWSTVAGPDAQVNLSQQDAIDKFDMAVIEYTGLTMYTPEEVLTNKKIGVLNEVQTGGSIRPGNSPDIFKKAGEDTWVNVTTPNDTNIYSTADLTDNWSGDNTAQIFTKQETEDNLKNFGTPNNVLEQSGGPIDDSDLDAQLENSVDMALSDLDEALDKMYDNDWENFQAGQEPLLLHFDDKGNEFHLAPGYGSSNDDKFFSVTDTNGDEVGTFEYPISVKDANKIIDTIKQAISGEFESETDSVPVDEPTIPDTTPSVPVQEFGKIYSDDKGDFIVGKNDEKLYKGDLVVSGKGAKQQTGTVIGLYAPVQSVRILFPDGTKSIKKLNAVSKTDKAPEANVVPENTESQAVPEVPSAADSVYDENMSTTTSPDDTALDEPTVVPEDLPELEKAAGLIDVSSWKLIKTSSGSNPGGEYEAPDGTHMFIKQSKSDLHAKNEVLASDIYQAAGVHSLELAYADVNGKGKLGTIAPMLDGAQDNFLDKLSDPEYKKAFQEGWAIDAWLGNWDVAGLYYDNALTDADGKGIRIDPGGALLFRAMGSPKSDAMFGDKVTEWDSMRTDPNNYQTKKVFGDMTDQQIIDSVAKVAAFTDKQIDDLVDKQEFEGHTAFKLKQKLKARRDDLVSRAAALNISETPGYVNQEALAALKQKLIDDGNAQENADLSGPLDSIEPIEFGSAQFEAVFAEVEMRANEAADWEDFANTFDGVIISTKDDGVKLMPFGSEDDKYIGLYDLKNNLIDMFVYPITSKNEKQLFLKDVNLAQGTTPVISKEVLPEEPLADWEKELLEGAKAEEADKAISDKKPGYTFYNKNHASTVIGKDKTEITFGTNVSYTKKGETKNGKVVSMLHNQQSAKVEWPDKTTTIIKGSQLTSTNSIPVPAPVNTGDTKEINPEADKVSIDPYTNVWGQGSTESAAQLPIGTSIQHINNDGTTYTKTGADSWEYKDPTDSSAGHVAQDVTVDNLKLLIDWTTEKAPYKLVPPAEINLANIPVIPSFVKPKFELWDYTNSNNAADYPIGTVISPNTDGKTGHKKTAPNTWTSNMGSGSYSFPDSDIDESKNQSETISTYYKVVLPEGSIVTPSTSVDSKTSGPKIGLHSKKIDASTYPVGTELKFGSTVLTKKSNNSWSSNSSSLEFTDININDQPNALWSYSIPEGKDFIVSKTDTETTPVDTEEASVDTEELISKSEKVAAEYEKSYGAYTTDTEGDGSWNGFVDEVADDGYAVDNTVITINNKQFTIGLTSNTGSNIELDVLDENHNVIGTVKANKTPYGDFDKDALGQSIFEFVNKQLAIPPAPVYKDPVPGDFSIATFNMAFNDLSNGMKNTNSWSAVKALIAVEFGSNDGKTKYYVQAHPLSTEYFRKMQIVDGDGKEVSTSKELMADEYNELHFNGQDILDAIHDHTFNNAGSSSIFTPTEGISLADIAYEDFAALPAGSKIEYKVNKKVFGTYLKNTNNSWRFQETLKDKPSDKSNANVDFKFLLENDKDLAANYTILPADSSEAPSDAPEVATVTAEKQYVFTHIKVDSNILDSYPVGTTVKQEKSSYYNQSNTVIFEKTGTGWSQWKKSNSTLTVTSKDNSSVAVNQALSWANASVSVSIPKSKDAFMLGNGELAYPGETVEATSIGGTLTIDKVNKSYINVIDGNGNKLKVPFKKMYKDQSYGNSKISAGYGSSSKYATDTKDPLATYVEVAKVAEKNKQAVLAFAGADVEEFKKQGLGLTVLPSATKVKSTGLSVIEVQVADPSHELFGKPAPTMPSSPDEYPSFDESVLNNLPKWDSVAWITAVEDRYKANPNKKFPTVQQSTQWAKIEKIIEGKAGYKNYLDSLLSSKYVDDDLYKTAVDAITKQDKVNKPLAKAHAENINKEKAEYEANKAVYFAEYDKKVQDYTKSLEEWSKVNVQTKDIKQLPNIPDFSATPFEDGPADWSKAHPGTHSLQTVLDSMRDDNVLGKFGMSTLVGGDKIEDGQLVISKILDQAGQEKFEVKFKVTAAFGDALTAKFKIDPEIKQSNGIYYAKKSNIMGKHFELPKMAGKPSESSFINPGTRFEFKDGVTSYPVVFQHASAEGHNVSVINNSVHMILDKNATPEDLQTMLQNMGIAAKPATAADLRLIAENKLVTLFSGKSNWGTENLSGKDRQAALDKVKEDFNVTVDDVVVETDANNRAKFFLTDAKAEELTKVSAVKQFKHGIYAGEDLDVWESLLAGTNPGLLSNLHRGNMGVGVLKSGTGMSPDTDMARGSGDHLFVTPQSTIDTSAPYGNYIGIKVKNVIRRLDHWSNSGDNYGKKDKSAYPTFKMIKDQGNFHETTLRDTVPVSDFAWVSIGSLQSKKALIKRLTDRGIFMINGIPLDKFILTAGEQITPIEDVNKMGSVVVPDVSTAAPSAPVV